MHWCISEHTTWVKWCGGVGLVAWAGGAVTWAGGYSDVARWLQRRGSGGLGRSLSFLSFFLSISLESSLHGSHSLVELMVSCGRSGWCRGGGSVGGDCVVDGRSRWCCGWLSVMSQMPRPRSNYI